MAKASMSQLQCCDAIASSMDGINVKIAEAYKPPRKVTLPAAYNNKLPDVTRPAYDFSLEKSVIEKLMEWRAIRRTNGEARRCRLENDRRRDKEANEMNDGEASVKEDITDVKDLENQEKMQMATTTIESTETNDKNCSENSEERLAHVKTIASTLRTTILTPQRLSPSVTDLRDNSSSRRNGALDYADFDNDTSSPFDNMELKTINDMEELAQVLQPTSRWIASEKVENIIKELSIENSHGDEDEDGETNDETTDTNAHENRNERNDKRNERNVSIIVEELERELARPCIENWKPWPDLESPEGDDSEATDVRGYFASNEPISPKDSTFPNPLMDLTAEDERLARHLSDMGFPLARVARVIRDLGDKDNKRVIEYLLAVQTLEEHGIPGDEAEKALLINDHDQERAKIYYENLCTLKTLGFPEDEASKALIKCDVDRDRALDFLIA